MNQAIEIHDSVIDRAVIGSSDPVLHFNRVYIHRSVGKPGWDSGSVWVQEAQLRFHKAAVQYELSELPCELLDGYLKLGGHLLQNIIPIPLDFYGEVELRLEGWGDFVKVEAEHVRLELLGTAEYVEDFTGIG